MCISITRRGRIAGASNLAIAVALIASSSSVGCGPSDAGTIKVGTKDEVTKALFPEGKTRSGKTIPSGGPTVPIAKKKR